MLLPKILLDQLEYYDIKNGHTFFDDRPYSKIRIHFKQWYRPAKTFKFKWILSNIDGDIVTYTEPLDASELKHQLKTYFVNANV